jgi:hypothetical protein
MRCFGSDTVTAAGVAHDGFVTAGAVIASLGFAANLLIVALTPTACAEAILRGHSMKVSFIGDIVGGCKSSARRT